MLFLSFYRMRLIESYGTGISKIQRGYENYSLKPKFETAKGGFRVTLPNRNYETIASRSVSVSFDDKEPAKKQDTRSQQEKEILDYVAKRGQITRKQVEELLSLGTIKAYWLLKDLCDNQKLQPEGNGRSRRYVPVNKR